MERFFLYRKTILLLLFLITLGLGWGLKHLRMDYSPQYVFRSQSEKFRQLEEYMKIYGKEDQVVMVLFEGEHLFTADNFVYLKKIIQDIQKIQGFHVRSLFDFFPSDTPPEELKKKALQQFWIRRLFLSEEGDVLALFLDLDFNLDKIEEIMPLLSKIEKVLEQPSPASMKIHLTGIPYIRKEIVTKLMEDQMLFVPLCALLFLLVLYYFFRQWSLVWIPFGAIGMAIIWILGLMGWCGKSIDILNNILPTLIFTIAISDSIHLIARYVHEIDDGKEQTEAIAIMVRHLTLACFLTSFTTAVGFASLGLAEIDILRHLGIYAGVGVMFAYVITILFVPVALTFTNPQTARKVPVGGAWKMKWFSHFLIRHPVAVMFAGLIFVGACGYMGRHVDVDNHLMETISKKDPVYQASMVCESKLAGLVPMAVVWEGDFPDLTTPEVLKAMDEIAEFLRVQPGMRYVIAPSDFIKEANYVMDSAFRAGLAQRKIPEEGKKIAFLIQGIEATQSKIWRRFVRPEHKSMRLMAFGKDVGAKKALQSLDIVEKKLAAMHFKGVKVYTGDVAPVAAPALQRLVKDLRDSLFTAFGIIFITLTLLFRSWKLGLVSIFPNIAPLLAALGYLGLVGLDLQSTTIFVFPIALGLAVDDTIHFLARYQEVMRKEMSISDAIEKTFEGTGKAIVSTTILLSLGFFVILFSNFPITQQFATLMEIIILTALAGDLFLLPASILLFKVRG